MKRKELLNHGLISRLLFALLLFLPQWAEAQIDYGLTVAGVAVTSDNADNITGANITTGKVSYNADSNTLILNGATLTVGVACNCYSMTVELVGTNTIEYDGPIFSNSYLDAGKLYFSTDEDDPGMLLTNATSEETLADGFQLDDHYYSLYVSFDAYGHYSIAKFLSLSHHFYARINNVDTEMFQYVTEANYDKLAGEEKSGVFQITASYDPATHVATLNGYSNIVWGHYNDQYTFRVWDDVIDELKVNLIGTNTVTTREDAGFFLGEALTFTTDVLNPGTLTIQREQMEYVSIPLFFDGSDSVTPDFESGLVLLSDDANYVYSVEQMFSGGDGSEGHPYVISTPRELKYFAQSYNNNDLVLDCYVELGDDIDCTGLTDYEPIGYAPGFPFYGYFDGKNHRITGLTLTTTPDQEYAGLFGVVGWYDNATPDCYVKNLTVENCTFGGAQSNAAIACDFESGLISHCTVDNCTVSTSGAVTRPFCGGVVGELTDGRITGCVVSGLTLSASSTIADVTLYVGGVAAAVFGYDATVSGCVVTGTDVLPTQITGNAGEGNKHYVGGILGSCELGTPTISGNRVTGHTTISTIEESLSEECGPGAIVSKAGDGAFTDNCYEYSVATVMTKGGNTLTTTGYDVRGSYGEIYDSSYEPTGEYCYMDDTVDDGVVLYTKRLTIPELTLTFEMEGTIINYYEPKSDVANNVFAFAPGLTTTCWVYPKNDGDVPEAVVLTYTPAGGSQQTDTFPNISADPDLYEFAVDLPDADATLSVTMQQSYDLWIGDTQVTSSNAGNVLDDAGSTVRFSEASDGAGGTIYTLTLDGATITAPVKVGLPNLTFNILGANRITTGTTCIQKTESSSPVLTFKSSGSEADSLTLKNTGDDYDGVLSSDFYDRYSINKELALVLLRYGTYTSDTYYLTAGEVHYARLVPSYGVRIGDMQVYEGNATDVLGDGTVSFDVGTNTLTLHDARILGNIGTWLSALDIYLVGNNSLDNYSDGPVFANDYGEPNINILMKTSVSEAGCLTMHMNSNANGFMDTNVSLVAEEPLLIYGNLNAKYNAYVTVGEDPGYELTVDNVRVVPANASDITCSLNADGRPEASFDVATGTLTLDQVSWSYTWTNNVAVSSDIADLTVKLVGENTITASTNDGCTMIFEKIGAAGTVSFTTEKVDGAYGSLLMKNVGNLNDMCDGYSIETDFQSLDDNVQGWLFDINAGNLRVWYQDSYGITVTKGGTTVVVSTDNRSDVLGDGNYYTPASVQYDGYNRLVLNDAQLTSILVSTTNNLPPSGLVVYLEGNSTITNNSGYALSVESADASLKLSFHTGCDAPGTLVCTNGEEIGSKNPFSGFDVSYNDHLAMTVHDNTATVQMPLGLIVDDIGTPATVSFTSSPAGADTTPLDNDIIDKVLYTLDDDGTVGSSDGFDGREHAIVINTVMTDADVALSDDLVPGTPEYAAAFKGITFIVPAGEGTITLNVKTQSGYAFHVRVGKQNPIEVVNSDSYDDVVIPFACAEASYVKIYLVSVSNAAPVLADSDWHRIGPKSTVSGGLGGMSVSQSSISSVPNASSLYRRMTSGDFSQTGRHIVVTAEGVTDLNDNAFGFSAATPAPRRAPSGPITYIDASNTQITGKSFSRTAGAFQDVPEETFIYLPAGNTAEGKNFVIGGICNDMLLYGNTDNDFEVAQDFTAAQATFDRQFEKEVKSTVFLPFAITNPDDFGTFYQFDSVNETRDDVNMTSTTNLQANMPYIFKAAQNATVLTQNCAQVMTYSPDDMPALTGFIGTYTRKEFEDGMYCFAGQDEGSILMGQFVKMGVGSYVPPFRAYMVSDSSANVLTITWDDEVPTDIKGVEDVQRSTFNAQHDEWYTLDGVRLSAKPTKKGLYIHNGKKVIKY